MIACARFCLSSFKRCCKPASVFNSLSAASFRAFSSSACAFSLSSRIPLRASADAFRAALNGFASSPTKLKLAKLATELPNVLKNAVTPAVLCGNSSKNRIACFAASFKNILNLLFRMVISFPAFTNSFANPAWLCANNSLLINNSCCWLWYWFVLLVTSCNSPSMSPSSWRKRRPASSPGPPNVSAMTLCVCSAVRLVSCRPLPTRCKACTVVILPLFNPANNSVVNFSPKAFVRASRVALVCSRIRRPNSFTASIPLSLYMPSC